MTDDPTRVRRPRRRARWLAAPLSVLACAATFTVPLLAAPDAHASGTLRAHAENRGKFIGFAAANNPLQNEPNYFNTAAAQFNQITAENAMKWDATEPRDGQYTFGGADQIVAFAESRNMVVHGHTLVWHAQTPDWVHNLNASAMRAAMQDHISTVMGRYANNPRVRSWDVVNEVFNENGTRRGSFWQNTMGDGYIADAFRFARAADPDARLCINDYNVEGINAKSTAMYNLVRSLRTQNVPVDCVGFQTHLSIQFGFPNDLQQNLQRFADLGVQVRITELDIRMPSPRTAAKDATQATYYRNVVNACNAVEACAGITIWGFTDRHSWIPGTFPSECCGLIYDSNYAQKPAYAAVHDALDGGRVDSTPPSRPGTLSSPSVTSTTVNLSWGASTDNVGVTGYDILQAPGATGGSFTVVGRLSGTGTLASHGGLTPNTTYRYQVRARDAAGNLSEVSNTITVTTAAEDPTPPSAPGTLSASGVTASSVDLSWGASTDNVGVTRYEILRATGATGGSYVLVGTSTSTSFTDTSLSANTTYRYQVQARDAAGNTSPVSNTVTVTTTGGGSCAATYSQIGQNWPGGFQGQVTVANLGTTTSAGWTLTVTFANGQSISQSWGGQRSGSGPTYTFVNEPYNGVLAPNGSTTVGFIASWNGSNTAPTVSCALR